MATSIAPYEVNVTASDDETFAFVVEWQAEDGTDFPFDDYEIEYAITEDGCAVLQLDEDDGITVADGVVEFKAARGQLNAGRKYRHGCRIRNLSSGDELMVFEGQVRISEGHFP